MRQRRRRGLLLLDKANHPRATFTIVGSLAPALIRRTTTDESVAYDDSCRERMHSTLLGDTLYRNPLLRVDWRAQM